MTEYTYYVHSRAPGLYDLRQTRYRALFQQGREHPHDLCAVSFTARALRELIERHRLDVDPTTIPTTEVAA
jgi:hypothetical protein